MEKTEAVAMSMLFLHVEYKLGVDDRPLAQTVT